MNEPLADARLEYSGEELLELLRNIFAGGDMTPRQSEIIASYFGPESPKRWGDWFMPLSERK